MVFFFRFLSFSVPMLFNETASLLFRTSREPPWPLAHRLLIKQLQVLKHVSFIITIIVRNKLVVRVI